MTEILRFTSEELAPCRDEVLLQQGIPAGTVLRPDIEAVYTRAVALLAEIAAPVAILGEISRTDFEGIYHGEGRNLPRTPVADILPQAEHLALFAATCGPQVSREIDRCFKSSDVALGAMLDAAASVLADTLGELVQRRFYDRLAQRKETTPATGVLRYSPGYCGWHISGQRRLFDFLHPQQIGLTLRPSFLMEPLKSISGVVIAGPREMHRIPMVYPACPDCKTHGCRERFRALIAQSTPPAAQGE
jgi:hypothetical protein